MNYIAKEIEDCLMHYGVKRRSGRYPWGSGDNPYQHSGDFLAKADELKKKGKTEKEIAKEILPGEDELSTTEYRVLRSIANEERRSALVDTAEKLREQGMPLAKIAAEMGYPNDSSVRSLLNKESKKRMNQAKVTADYLKQMVDEKGMIDVGKGVERELGVTKTKLEEALTRLYLDGYEIHGVGLPQQTNMGKNTTMMVLCPPGTPHKEAYNFDKVSSVKDYDKILVNDGNDIRKKLEYPESLDSKRLQVVYGDQGGSDKDGVVELRRGVKDLDLGGSHYSQVRIMVDGTHYIKGMAVYADDLPDGIDVRFNTNKKSGTPIMGEKDHSVLKPISKDPNNPFKSLIKEPDRGGQSYYDDPNGKFVNNDGTRQSLSLINKRADEGDWQEWSNKLPSQFLAKQPKELIEKQLGLSKAEKVAEFDEIKSLTNPTVKRNLLNSFANDCDSAAVHLHSASLPRQQYQVILPLNTIKDNEVYAPNYKPGEKVALIRYPHEGIFQIPILTVNNKNKEGDSVITKNAKDAVGISKKVADQLSGADFDGDTVMVIPVNNRVKIKNKSPLKDLEGFDAKIEYGPDSTDKPYKRMKDTQKQMGVISNLIMDMTLKGASEEELARAVKHSQTVIDAEKHNLDYKRSEKENGIAELKKRYQGRVDEDGKYHEGASTLITRAKGEKDVLKRKGSPHVNEKGKDWYDPTRPEGALVYKNADQLTYVDKKGKTHTRTQKSTQMAEVDDARKLISDLRSPKEELYAEYANTMKDLARQARMEALHTERLKVNPTAKKTYKPQVESLMAQLKMAELNAPRERRAQAIAGSRADAKIKSDPELTKDDIKKIRNRELLKARTEVGAKRHPVKITDKEWEAIQAGAISDTTLDKLLKNADIDEVRKRATPRTSKTPSAAKIARIKALKASGRTNQEIAEATGFSVSTISKYL